MCRYSINYVNNFLDRKSILNVYIFKKMTTNMEQRNLSLGFYVHFPKAVIKVRQLESLYSWGWLGRQRQKKEEKRDLTDGIPRKKILSITTIFQG